MPKQYVDKTGLTRYNELINKKLNEIELTPGPTGANGKDGAKGDKGDNGISYAPNIAQKTNQGITGWSWGNAYGGVIREEVVEDGINCAKLTRDDVENTGWSYIAYSEIGRKYYRPSTDYVISFDCKPNVLAPFNSASFMTPSAGSQMLASYKVIQNVTTANEWNHVVVQARTKNILPETTTQVLYISITNKDCGTSYMFRNLVITEGTEDRPWVPSTDDMKGEKGEKGEQGAAGEDGAGFYRVKPGWDMTKLVIPLENLYPSTPKPKKQDSVIYEDGTIGAIGSVTSTDVTVLPLHISLKGPKGDKGEKGTDGINGTNGTNGKDGTGITSIDVKASTVDDGNNVVTVNLSDGTNKSFNVKNGSKGSAGTNGTNGKDGVSVTHSWNGTTLSVTSASGTSSANLKGDKGEKGDPGTIDLTKVVTLSDSQNISGEKTFSTAPKTSKKYDSYEDIFDLSKFESGELSKDAFLLLLESGLYSKFITSDTEIPSMKSVAQMIGGVLNAGLGCKLISDISYETCTEEELQEAINNSD